MKNNIDDVLNSLSMSKFRSSFKLNTNMINYVKDKGLEKIKNDAYDIISRRIMPAFPKNDGKQTPMKGHPVFIAQHATATCCRNCLEKWHHIPKNKPLTEEEIHYIVSLIIKWIEKEMKGK